MKTFYIVAFWLVFFIINIADFACRLTKGKWLVDVNTTITLFVGAVIVAILTDDKRTTLKRFKSYEQCVRRNLQAENNQQ